jgi:hypothetical protein
MVNLAQTNFSTKWTSLTKKILDLFKILLTAMLENSWGPAHSSK